MQHRLSPKEVVERGEAIYQEKVRQLVEPDHVGKFLVLDIDTEQYEIDEDEVAAIRRAKTRNPGGERYIKRVGFRHAHRLGGSSFGRQ
jgi:hypothetical protein